jgi:peptide/nickel transport system permease protein
MATVTILSLVIAIPIGIISAVKQYSKLDYAVTTFSFFGISMPVFWFGLLMIMLFTLQFQKWGLPYFPSGDVFTTRVTPGSIQAVLGIVPYTMADRIVHLILPVTVLTLLYLAGWSRFMRSSMLEVLRQDYVRTARAKGLLERTVIAKHATRNALIPLVTIVVLQIPGIFSGAIVTETIFNYPGMGRLFIDALSRDDWPIVMAILFISAILVVVATLVGDILYTVIDPRIRFD